MYSKMVSFVISGCYFIFNISSPCKGPFILLITKYHLKKSRITFRKLFSFPSNFCILYIYSVLLRRTYPSYSFSRITVYFLVPIFRNHEPKNERSGENYLLITFIFILFHYKQEIFLFDSFYNYLRRLYMKY